MKKKILTGLTAFSLCAMIAIPAKASQFVGLGQATAYWDCK